MTPDELRFYYLGFHAALRRHLRATYAGWSVAFLGLAGLLLRWHAAGIPGLADILLAALLVAAGVALVQVSVAAITAYAGVPFPAGPGGGEPDPALERLRELMRQVEQGGWQDAREALQALRALQQDRSLPPLE